MAAFERLTALDQSFLEWEQGNVYMHVAATMVFDAAPLRTEDGGIDFGAIRKHIESALVRVPRYRQKIAHVPIEGRAVWIDDEHFDLDYHVRHVGLPRPGSEQQLKELSARIMQQPLDRRRPLWEMWVVEGVDGGSRFAVISKVHHCMVDGIAGVDLMMMLLSADPDERPGPVRPFVPRCRPSGVELLTSEVLRRASLPLEVVRNLGSLRRELGDLRHDLATRLGGLARTLVSALRPASDTPFNGPLGPHRRFDWTRMELAEVKQVARALGGTVNDIVLTTVTGAVRRFLQRRGIDPRTIHFRVLAPVSVRGADERGVPGNRVAVWLVELPVDEANPRRQLRRIRAQTAKLKESKQALGAELLAEVADWTTTTLLSVAARAATRLRAFNMIVTNVPGPQVPLYMIGARLLEAYPLVPLFDNQGLGVALLSYDGRLFWGFNADYDRLPDLRDFVEDVETAFDRLRRAAAPKRAAAGAATGEAGGAGRSGARPRGAAAEAPREPPRAAPSEPPGPAPIEPLRTAPPGDAAPPEETPASGGGNGTSPPGPVAH